MANSKLTVNEQVRKLNQEQHAVYRKLHRLAPAGAIEYAGTTDGTLLTWQSTWEAVANAAACLDDLAGDSVIDDLAQAEMNLEDKSLVAVKQQAASNS